MQRDSAAYATDHGQGALIVHFQNAVGSKAQVVDIGHTLTVTRGGFGGGSVTSSPAGVKCGSTCVGSFATGTPVKLTAKASPVSTFAHWSGGGCSKAGACHVTLNTDVSVTAVFHRDRTKPRMTRVKVKANHRARTARVRFRGTDPSHGSKGLRFKCKLDKKRFASCRSPKLYKHLTPRQAHDSGQGDRQGGQRLEARQAEVPGLVNFRRFSSKRFSSPRASRAMLARWRKATPAPAAPPNAITGHG